MVSGRGVRLPVRITIKQWYNSLGDAMNIFNAQLSAPRQHHMHPSHGVSAGLLREWLWTNGQFVRRGRYARRTKPSPGPPMRQLRRSRKRCRRGKAEWLGRGSGSRWGCCRCQALRWCGW